MVGDHMDHDLEDDRPVAVILTALGLEFEAVVDHLENVREEHDRHGTIFEVGDFRGERQHWKVAVVETGPGNQRAGDFAHYAIQRFDPRVILFVGVAGSLKEDVLLGDVVASTDVYQIHSGKAGESFSARPKVGIAAHALEQRARSVRRQRRWLERIKRKPTDPYPHPSRTPDSHVGPIAAGEQVVAHEQSEAYKIIKSHYSDAVAVEMEGYGTLATARIPKIDAIIIRGISDNVVDKGQCDQQGWQPAAAQNASAFAFELLSLFQVGGPLPGRDRQTPDPSTPPGPGPDAPRQPSPDEIDARMASTSQRLLGWETTLDRGEWLNRPELQQVESWLGSEDARTLVLLGDPGSGKSALLARLGQRAKDRGTPVLAIKADLIDPSVRSLADLSRELGLPLDITECVRRVAATKEVVVLIDQLDALAALVDLRSERLNVLLDLIRDLSTVENVRVVCSSRSFEYRHDVRLTSIRADEATLSLPTWDQVFDLLKERGIDATGWPEPFRELLRTPQHLRVFLERLRDSSEYRFFNSYHQMLDDLWARRVSNPGGLPDRAKLLMEIADEMASKESLWLPLVRFEGREEILRDLEANGILWRHESGLRIGFQHQTLFEHARARAFARGHGSIASYTLSRQNSLFVRPTLWNTLRYLREAAPDAYQEEMQQLWEQTTKLHLRFLLIDFLGQVREPTEREQVWMIEALGKPDWRLKALASVRGGEAWFAVLAPSQLPAVMLRGVEEAWPAVPILAEALQFARREGFDLIKRHWLPDPAKDSLTWRVLEQLAEWDEETAGLACVVARRSELSPSDVMSLATAASAHAPALAPRIVSAAFERTLRGLELTPDPPEPIRGDDEAEEEFQVRVMMHKPKERFERLLKHNRGWYDLPALAEAAPEAFLDQLRPWLLRVLNHLESGQPRGKAFKTSWALSVDLDRGDGTYREESVLGSFDVAITALAEQEPDAFVEFLRREGKRDSHFVQRLLCRGLRAAAGSRPRAGLDFLKEDGRRFELGSFEDRHEDSTALITAIVPHLGPGKRLELEDAILAWEMYDGESSAGEPELRFKESKWNREHRLRLLKAFPQGTLSAKTQRLVDEEVLALPHYMDSGFRIEGGIIGSPMSAEQMAKAKDDHLINLFDELPDETHFDHPRRHLMGGSVQASREFGRLAGDDPRRAVGIIRGLSPGKQERPVTAALREIAKSDYPDTEFFELITQLDQRGFESEEFRSEAAAALRERLREGEGLPGTVRDLLEKWRVAAWSVMEEPREPGDGKEEHPESVLWNDGHIVSIPPGSYHVLHTLTYAYLMHDPPLASQWLAMLEDHVQRPERSATWRMLGMDLRHLRRCDREGSAHFLRELFTRYPGVRDSGPGAGLITHLWDLLPDTMVDTLLAEMRDGPWHRGPQAYGELLALRAMLFPENQAVRDELYGWLGPEPAHDERAGPVRLGISYTAIHSWNQPGKREIANDLLIKLIAIADNATADAIMSLFWVCDGLPADDHTRTLLGQILEHPWVLSKAGDNLLVEHLECLLPGERELVFGVSRELVRLRGQELISIQTSFATSAPHLTNIALTLQRIGGEYRDKGLELFEQLLMLGVQDAQAVLNELDRRPGGAVRHPIPRRRRRRRAG